MQFIGNFICTFIREMYDYVLLPFDVFSLDEVKQMCIEDGVLFVSFTLFLYFFLILIISPFRFVIAPFYSFNKISKSWFTFSDSESM